jgi:hypothetical protein
MSLSSHTIVLFLNVLLLAALVSAVPAFAVTPFVVETVDVLGDGTPYFSVAADGQGNPHIAYFDIVNTDLMYAVKRGPGWVVETVDDYGAGLYARIAVDAQGNPHICYWSVPTQELTYAVKLAGEWQIDHTGIGDKPLSLAIDKQGNPHVGLIDVTAPVLYDLHYAFKQEGSWVVEIVDTTAVISDGSMALDGQGVPHLAYRRSNAQELRYAVRVGAMWTSEVADSPAVDVFYPSIAMDSQDRPHISYYERNSGDLKYAKKSNDFWSIQTIDNFGVVGLFSSIVLDHQDNIHISYYDNSYSDLRYTTNKGGWTVQTVDDLGIVGRWTSLALDGYGNPHIAYHDSTTTELKYAGAGIHLTSPVGGETWLRGEQTHVTWDGLGEVDIFVSEDGGASYVPMRSGVSGGGTIVSVPAWTTEEARVKIVRNDPYAASESPDVFSIAMEARLPWWTEEVDSVGNSYGYPSLALGPEGTPHISYRDRVDQDLKYAIRRGGRWETESVASTSILAAHTTLRLDAQGIPHISWQDNIGNNILKYAVKTGGVWTIDTVEATGGTSYYASLALDPQGVPSIGYFDGSNADLKYVTKSGGVWLTSETVDDVGDVGRFPSLVMDAEGNPHLSYHSATDTTLKYAHKIDGMWTIETVDSGNVGTYTSIALDATGNPAISYFDGDKNTLTYAVRVDGTWSFEMVGRDGLYGSLAFDALGTPYISYAEWYGAPLTLAVRRGNTWFTRAVGGPDSGGPTSLALDAQGNPHIVYDIAQTDQLRYASSVTEVAEPSPGVIWPVGASRAVTWDGTGVVDVSLSTDGGVMYKRLASDVSNGYYMLSVPHTPSRFCKIKIERRAEANTFATYYHPQSVSVTDSFFTIETSVSLLSMFVVRATGGGNRVSWATDPGPEDLDGYRLEKSRDRSNWMTLVSLTKDTSHHDPDGVAGEYYRLFAVNGLGEELYVGEASDGNVPPIGGRLAVWPVPFRDGELNVSFPTGGPGGVAEFAEVVVYDVMGRHIKTIARGTYPVGVRRATWDGRDDGGKLAASGIYFVRATSGATTQTRKLVIVR